ncbi:MAG TPA: hypothetical protein VIJ25_00665, partial [Methylococcales bacterium]
TYGTLNWIDSPYIYLYVKPNQNIGIKFENSLYHTMHIFANPPKPAVPAGALYFGPGVHDVGLSYTLSPSQNVVYLDGGAWVKGTLNIINAKNVKIIGPGVLSGENWPWESISTIIAKDWNEANKYFLIHAHDNGPAITDTPIEIKGTTLVASPAVNINLNNLASLDIDNVHVLSPWTYNTDAFDVQGNNVNITNSFSFVNDNTLIAEFSSRGEYNVTDCVINGRTINVGYGYFTSLTSAANLNNIDIIYPEFASLLPEDPTWHTAVFEAKIDGSSSNIVVENQYYNNIVIDGDVDQLFEFVIDDTVWGAPGPAQGNMRNINFKNIELLGKQRFKSEIKGKDNNNQIHDITFTNLKIDGTYVDADNYQDFFDIGKYTYNISFIERMPRTDLNNDGVSDFSDLVILAAHWLKESTP